MSYASIGRLRGQAVFFLLAAWLGAGCGGDSGPDSPSVVRHPQDFLPQQVGNMIPAGTARTATTATELQEIIDGGYSTYTKHAFREFVQQTYQGTVGGTEAVVVVWIFEVATSDDAHALHLDEDVQTGNCQDLTGIGQEERLCLGLGNKTLQIRREQYWTRITIDESSADAEELLKLFAAHVDQKITE